MRDSNSILNVEVSQFDGYKNPFNPVPVNLLDWLFDEKYKQSVVRLRQKQFDNIDEYRKIKQSLPAVTISGIFEQRLNEGLIKHSGLICVDIDSKDNSNNSIFLDLKCKLSTAPFVAYCGHSISGKGYFVIIPIKYPDKHKAHFMALQKLFAQVGIIIDAACKDVCRLRGYSWDDSPFINHNAIPFGCIVEEVPIKRPKRYMNYHSGGNDTRSWVEKYINEITGKGIDITTSYEDWRDIGFAFADEFGENGRLYFHDVSRWYSKYNYGEANNQFTYCLNSNRQGGRITISTFFQLCKEAGITFKHG